MNNFFSAQQEIIDRIISKVTLYKDICNRVTPVFGLEEVERNLQFNPSIKVGWFNSGSMLPNGNNAILRKAGKIEMTWLVFVVVNNSQSFSGAINETGELISQIIQALIGFELTGYYTNLGLSAVDKTTFPSGIPVTTMVFKADLIIGAK